MGTMKTIQGVSTDGDATVGRNATIGGDATVRGSMKVGLNLKIEGWLDAPNVKGPNKGLFQSAELLRESYPCPRTGWWALVGEEFPATLYVVEGRKWVTTGKTVSSGQYDEALSVLEERQNKFQTQLTENKEKIEETASSVSTLAEDLTEKTSVLSTQMGELQELGGGIAVFDGFIEEAPELTPNSATGQGAVVYCKATGCFIMASIGIPTKFYANWQGASAYGDFSINGRMPVSGRLYVDASGKRAYVNGAGGLRMAIAGNEPFVNVNAVCEDTDYTLQTALQAMAAYEESGMPGLNKRGLIITYRTGSDPDTWETKQWQGSSDDEIWTEGTLWKDLSGGSGVEIARLGGLMFDPVSGQLGVAFDNTTLKVNKATGLLYVDLSGLNIPAASSTKAGLMSAEDKAKIDSLEATYAAKDDLTLLSNKVDSSAPRPAAFNMNRITIVKPNDPLRKEEASRWYTVPPDFNIAPSDIIGFEELYAMNATEIVFVNSSSGLPMRCRPACQYVDTEGDLILRLLPVSDSLGRIYIGVITVREDFVTVRWQPAPYTYVPAE